jgi:hypothetical protein
LRTKSLEKEKRRKWCLEDEEYKHLFIESDFLRYTFIAFIALYFKNENLFRGGENVLGARL